MEGIVLDFNQHDNKGAIKSDEGERFNFTKENWKSADNPVAGMKVDFVPENTLATQIYSLGSGSVIPQQVTEKISELTSSDMQQKIKALFDDGVYNKIGFGTSIAAILTSFMPALSVPFGDNVSLIGFGSGWLICLLLIVLAIFFYGGVKQRFTKILGSVVLLLVVLQYFSLFGLLGQTQNTFGLVLQAYREQAVIEWGFYLNFLVNVVLALALFKLPYNKNAKTI